jgi:hypothetical protein
VPGRGRRRQVLQANRTGVGPREEPVDDRRRNGAEDLLALSGVAQLPVRLVGDERDHVVGRDPQIEPGDEGGARGGEQRLQRERVGGDEPVDVRPVATPYAWAIVAANEGKSGVMFAFSQKPSPIR